METALAGWRCVELPVLNLDTHILILALAGDLTKEERLLLNNDRWSISAIVLWELNLLLRLRRIELDIDSAEFVAVLSRLHIWPLTFEICRQVRALDFKSDPADQLIAATSIVHHAPLLTRDRRIRRSKLVPLAGRRSLTPAKR